MPVAAVVQLEELDRGVEAQAQKLRFKLKSLLTLFTIKILKPCAFKVGVELALSPHREMATGGGGACRGALLLSLSSS